jgi:hypothetical protein
MSQSMPEVLDYRDLMGKLARIDSEWESLKGLLAFRGPYKNEKPGKGSAVNRESQMDMGNKVMGFPKPAPHVKSQKEFDGGPSAIAVTPRELEAIYQENGKTGSDGTSLERLIKVEKQIHKLTFLVITCMTLTMVMFAVLAFLMFKDNLLSRSASLQPMKTTALSSLSSPEPKVSANTHQTPSVVPMASDSQLARAASMPAKTVDKSSETESPPAAPEPAPKFVGSRTSNKIHTPDCKWAAKIKPERLITFPSIAAAREQGYIPCPVCRPHESDETN